MRLAFIALLFSFLFPPDSFSQKGNTTVGIQVKPIFPFEFLGTGAIDNDLEGVQFETLLESGFSAGMIVRHNFTNILAFETGISYVKRKYSLKITDGDFTGNSSFRIISYEVPAVLMVYAQATEKIYFNGSLGVTLDLFASSIRTFDYYFDHISYRNRVVQPAINANVGVEYRTEKSGNIYLGASFQRPFDFIYLSKVLYDRNNHNTIVANELTGTYLTIDLRYYFPIVGVKK